MRKATLMCIALGLALILCPALLFGTTYPLYAGKTMPVGTVTVSGSSPTLTVAYVLNMGYALVETHLHVAQNCAEIPQKNGNPIPGQFSYKRTYSPPRTPGDEYNIDVSGLNLSLGVCIAAHATVAILSPGASTNVLVSGQPPSISTSGIQLLAQPVATNVTAKRIPPQTGTSGLQPAVLAWEPTAWATALSSDPNGQYLVAAGAKWIWDLYRVGCTSSVCPDTNPETVWGSVVRLQHDFFLAQAPMVSGLLRITCDNGYVASLNGTEVGRAQVNGNVGLWSMSTFLNQATVPTGGWQTVEAWNVSSLLRPGQPNTLSIDAANEEFKAKYDHPVDGTIDINPAGCIFALTVVGGIPGRQETAWGAPVGPPGGNPFPGKNWATYILYQ